MKKSKNGKENKVIAFLLLAVIVGIVISVAPWILVVAGFVGLVVLFAKIDAAGEKAKKANTSNQRGTPSGPLSVAVNNDIRIMTESLELVNHSSNLQTVISRYNVLVDALGRLCEYENNPAVSFPHELPSAALERIKSEKPQIMNRAVQRAYDDVLHKCATLKTEKGRKNRQMKFFDELNALMENFPPETQDFVVDFVNQNINDPLTHLEGL